MSILFYLWPGSTWQPTINMFCKFYVNLMLAQYIALKTRSQALNEFQVGGSLSFNSTRKKSGLY